MEVKESQIVRKNIQNQSGFSLLELIIAMTLMLVLLGAATTLLTSAYGTRSREINRTDALTSARAALNTMSMEIANTGYGLEDNGIVAQDSNNKKLHFRSNLNNDTNTGGPGEDVTYYYDSTTGSVMRYGANDNPQIATLINRTSDLNFEYFNYTGTNSAGTQVSTPTADTGVVRITVIVRLPNVAGQPNNRTVTLTSDVTLRNSSYMLRQY